MGLLTLNRIVVFMVMLFVTYEISGQTDSIIKPVELIEKGAEYVYTDKDVAYQYFDEAQKIAKKNGDWENMLNALFYKNESAAYFTDLTTNQKNIAMMDSLFERKASIIDTMQTKNELLSALHYYKGNYFFDIENYTKSRNNFQALLKLIDSIEDNQQTVDDFYYQSVAYSFLAKMLFNEKKYDQAWDYYDLNIRLLKQKMPSEKDLLYGNYALLAEVLREEGNLTEANKNLNQVLAYDLKENSNPNRILSAALGLSQNHLDQAAIDSAHYYLEVARPFRGANASLNSYFLRTEAKIRKSQNDFSASEKLLNTAIAQLQSENKASQNIKLSGLYLELGKGQLESKNYDKAIGSIDQGLKTNGFAVDSYTIELVAHKAKALNLFGNPLGALETAEKGISILDSLKISFASKADKANLIEESYPLFEEAIKATLAQYEENKNASMVSIAFRLFEKSKSILLLDALLNADAEQFAGIPQSVLDTLNGLDEQITLLEKSLELSDSPNEVELRDSLFIKKKQSLQLIKSLEKQYPNYYALKYGNNVSSVEDISKLWSTNDALISYFYGNDAVYALFLSKGNKSFKRIGNPKELEKKVKSYYELLSNPESELAQIWQLGQELYTELLSPFPLNSLHSLTILPDGILNYLPFETLTDPDRAQNYLLENLNLGYAPSATTLVQLSGKNYEQADVLAFAPTFNEENVDPRSSRDVLQPLPFAQMEVLEILQKMPGKAYEAEAASVQNFKQHSKEYGLLHFATHAVFNDKNPEFSYLAFSPNTTGPLLFVKDIYNQEIRANMVTLSACETALGDLKRGEGFIGLASSFYYAGASSITSTLWKVNDGTSAKIMASFYGGLSDGKPKNEALRLAKLEFLSSYSETKLAHPYYWAGFVLSGNVALLEQETPWLLYVIPLIILAALGLFLFGRKKRLQSNA